jgi:hypothetical protein
MTDAPRAKPPKGWMVVPTSVVVAVDMAIQASNLDTLSPRYVSMVRTLHTKGAKLGPTTVDALKGMLRDADETIYQLLGGDETSAWVFAPKEYEAYWNELERFPPDMPIDPETTDDPKLRASYERHVAALTTNIASWDRAHPAPEME